MKYRIMDTLTLKAELASKSVILIDVRDSDVFECEHIPGAVSIPLAQLPGHIDQALRKPSRIVVYSGSCLCDGASRAAERLTRMGYTNVWVYDAGIHGWKLAGLPTLSMATA